MRLLFHPRGTLVGVIALACLLSSAKTAWSREAVCDDVAHRGHLNVLTINLLWDEVETRNERLARIAAAVADRDVDVILLQEVAGGLLVRTRNVGRDLQRILRTDHDLRFKRRTGIGYGVPGLLSVTNATLSRCAVVDRQVRRLSRALEFEVLGRMVAMPRNVLMTRLDVPGLGEISVYNTHLCASCPIAEREAQLAELLDFIEDAESSLPYAGPIVLGGDFNIDIFRDDEAQRPMYDRIIESGFVDAYAEWADDRLERLCEPPAREPDEHCTVGVAKLNGSNARRIDYILTRDFGPVVDGGVLFNTLINADEPTVSDHAGVFTSIELPELLW